MKTATAKATANLVNLRHAPTRLVVNGVDTEKPHEQAEWVADMINGGNVDPSSKIQHDIDSIQVDTDLTKRGSDNNMSTISLTLVSANPRLIDSPHAKLLAQSFLERSGYPKPFFKRVGAIMAYNPNEENPASRIKMTSGLKSETGKFATSMTFVV